MRSCDSAASYTVQPSSEHEPGNRVMIYDADDCWRLRQEMDKGKSSQRYKLSLFNALGVLQNSCEHLTHEEIEHTNGERFEVQSFTTRTRKAAQPVRANAIHLPALTRPESFASRSVATETVKMVDACMNTSPRNTKQVTIQEEQNTCHFLPTPQKNYLRRSYYENEPINWHQLVVTDDRPDYSERSYSTTQRPIPVKDMTEETQSTEELSQSDQQPPPPPVPRHRTANDSSIISDIKTASEQVQETVSQILPPIQPPTIAKKKSAMVGTGFADGFLDGSLPTIAQQVSWGCIGHLDIECLAEI
ncbi:hypothetical protein Ciccas_002889 [Cichlidogyrus casuarinus]|uniref:Uncharacterized protein n=1 Tax=Cichlidogyrus casuarinus TaxID=1844966 RepID=A0ABD2QGX0_9PLAT